MAAAATLSAAVLAKVRDEVRWRVDGGYDARNRIVERVLDIVPESSAGAGLQQVIEHEVDAQLEEHARAEATWQGATDADKLDRAFAALERDGILTQQHFAGATEDAESAFTERIAQGMPAGKHLRGWVLFTELNTQWAVQGHELNLTTSSIPFNATAARALNELVVARLKASGFQVEWPYQDLAYSIRILNLSWKKRRLKSSPP